jgi:imidazolonepropionase-like amidohydrolase
MFIVLVILLIGVVALPAQTRPIFITNVTVITMTGDPPRANMTVVVSGKRIVKISTKVKIPRDSNTIDGAGKFLIPGLWDIHSHVFNNVSKGAA